MRQVRSIWLPDSSAFGSIGFLMTFSFFGGLCDDEVATMPLDMRLRGSDGRGNLGGFGCWFV